MKIIFGFISLLISISASSACLSKKEIMKRVCSRDISNDYKCSQKNLFFVHSDSCIGNKALNNLLPEIINAKEGVNIRNSNLKERNSIQIAESLVYRLHKKSNSGFEVQDINLWKDSRIQLAFSDKYFRSIVEKGFLNQYETNLSGGILDQERRASVESKMIQANLIRSESNKELNKLHPKYAFFGFDGENNLISTIYSKKYGNIIAVMKDKVKKRSTWTSMDSLDLYSIVQNMATEHGSRSFYDLSFIEKRFKKIYPDDTMEVQIWGELTLSDVDYLLVGCYGPKIPSHFIKDYDSLKLEVPVYACQLAPGIHKGKVLKKSRRIR